MSNELNCEIVKDLMANYIDSLTSEKTNEFLKNHIESCESCRKAYLLLSEKDKYERTVENNLKEAKKLKRYMNKIRYRNLILGVVLASIIIITGYFVYQEFFNISNYKEPSSSIQVSELYQLNDDYVYFTIKNISNYEINSMSVGNIELEDDKNSIGISISRTRVGKKVSSNLTSDEKNIQSSRRFVIDTKSGDMVFLESFMKKNNNVTKEQLIDYAANADEKYILNSDEAIEYVYYVGNKENDKKLIWEEGMVLPEYP